MIFILKRRLRFPNKESIANSFYKCISIEVTKQIVDPIILSDQKKKCPLFFEQ